MFEEKYKSTFDKIKPPTEVVNKSINAALEKNERKSNNIGKRIIACGLAAVLVIASVLIALNRNRNEYEINGIRPANNLKDIENFIKAEGFDYIMNSQTVIDTAENGVKREDQLESEYKADESTTNEVENENDYSDTNNQVVGVQEADIVKTDGEYIYSLDVSNQTLYITHTNNGKVTKLSSVKISAGEVFEMLLIGDYISVIGSNDGEMSETVMLFYDITDKENPEYRYSLKQDGYYLNSRAIESCVIVITNKYSVYNKKQDTISLPKINGKEISASNVWLPDTVCSQCFTVITSHNVKNNGEFNSAISVLTIYASKENLYLSSSVRTPYGNDVSEYCKSKSDIYRITLSDSVLNVSGCGSIDGRIKDQFSFDEKDGILRVATNVEYMARIQAQNGYYYYERKEMHNKVVCLDEKLEIIGESEPVGLEEEIKSVRYIGDTAYVVTFMKTDPLYAIDLSNPQKPKVLSELKITGFSSYMQPYTDNLLLGIGFEANSLNGITTGLKLTMFDVTDSNNVYDVSSVKYMWNDSYASTEATYNHKAVLINGRKGIIAIPLQTSGAYIDNGNSTVWKNKLSYLFFEFDGNTLKEKKKIEIDDFLNIDGFLNNGEFKDSSMRGIFINDFVYIICSEGIVCVSLNSYEVIDTLSFN